MKSAFRSAIETAALTFSLRSSINPRALGNPLVLRRRRAASPTVHSLFASMAHGDSGPGEPSPLVFSLEKQFEEFRHQLDDTGALRERIRNVATEIESATRIMHSNLLLIHQSRPLPDILEKARGQITVLKDLYSKLKETISECPNQYYRFHGDWRSETQAVVSLLAFMHWLEFETLLLHKEAEEKLGLNPSEFGLDTEDYLVGICFMSNEMPRYVVNQVTAGDYDCPRKVLKFLTDLHASFRMLNLRNDFLRKKFDGMKYDLRKVEEVYYDVKIRGLMEKGNKTKSEEQT
ncbi:uncharacterized protein LOC127239555 [Andrographis paniculata]|uniref:uncharacterized protein LOC127239555 n=1 Tax=Andrographis paniculata TaxID=175694 RepID=UPI0021E7B9D1|nr:uncharacterized protein LOC127239555 [Andrographis paniculata]